MKPRLVFLKRWPYLILRSFSGLSKQSKLQIMSEEGIANELLLQYLSEYGNLSIFEREDFARKLKQALRIRFINANNVLGGQIRRYGIADTVWILTAVHLFDRDGDITTAQRIAQYATQQGDRRHHALNAA